MSKLNSDNNLGDLVNEIHLGVTASGSADTSTMDVESLLEATLQDPQLVQHITRTSGESGETLVGYFRIKFEPGQKRQILHIPLVPPFSTIPSVEAFATDAGDVRIRITDRQKFGIRAEVILSDLATTNEDRMIEVVATECH